MDKTFNGGTGGITKKNIADSLNSVAEHFDPRRILTPEDLTDEFCEEYAETLGAFPVSAEVQGEIWEMNRTFCKRLGITD